MLILVKNTETILDTISEIINKYLEDNSKVVLEPGIERIPSGVLYRRGDLADWGKQAKEEGKDAFYVRPVDPLQPYGKLEKCEPNYIRIIEMVFSEIKIVPAGDEPVERAIKMARDLGSLCYIAKDESGIGLC